MKIELIIKFTIKGQEVELTREEANALHKALGDALGVKDVGGLDDLLKRYKRDSEAAREPVRIPYPVPYPATPYPERPPYTWEVWCKSGGDCAMSIGQREA